MGHATKTDIHLGGGTECQRLGFNLADRHAKCGRRVSIAFYWFGVHRLPKQRDRPQSLERQRDSQQKAEAADAEEAKTFDDCGIKLQCRCCGCCGTDVNVIFGGVKLSFLSERQQVSMLLHTLMSSED